MDISDVECCPWCMDLFPTSEFLTHVNIKCEKRCEDCLICGNSFRAPNLKTHQLTHYSHTESPASASEGTEEASVEPTVCPFCGKSSLIKEYIMEHIFTEHPEQSNSCPDPFVLTADEINDGFRETNLSSDDSDFEEYLDDYNYYDDDDDENIDDIRSTHVPSSINVQTNNQHYSEINNEAAASSSVTTNTTIPKPTTEAFKPTTESFKPTTESRASATEASKPTPNTSKLAAESVPKPETSTDSESDHKFYNMEDTFDETHKKDEKKSNTKRPTSGTQFDGSFFYRSFRNQSNSTENQSRNSEYKTESSDVERVLNDDEDDDEKEETLEQFLSRSKEFLQQRLKDIQNCKFKEQETSKCGQAY